VNVFINVRPFNDTLQFLEMLRVVIKSVVVSLVIARPGQTFHKESGV